MGKEYFPVVVQAVAGENRIVYAYFSDGQIKQYDWRRSLRTVECLLLWLTTLFSRII